MKQGILVALVVVGIIAAAVIFGGSETVTANPSNHNYGNESSKVTLIEYGDFECSGCGSFYPLVKQIKEEFKDQIRFQFVHFPLVQNHVNAIAAHRAAEAAANQGKFWEMHDMLFERQKLWYAQASNNPVPLFEQYAVELGLNIDQFKADVAKSETLAVINADIAKGKDLDIDSTPTFYINDKLIESTTSVSTLESFRSTIQAALDEANGTESTSETPSNETTDPTTTPAE